MAGTAAPDAVTGRALDAIVPARSLAGLLFALVAVPQLLLWRFLGFGVPILGLGSIVIAVLGVGVTRAFPATAGPSLRLTGAAASVALVLFLLGGEGRFFYANTDWQIRDAVLRDLVINPWPWAYSVRAAPDMLRVPLAMYLLPALAGKAAGFRAAELALLAQNAAVLTALLALGAALFEGTRRRAVALAVFLAFSGMDVIGVALAGGRLGGHLEWWGPSQFSSHVTQAFWVPQHALAGWAGALLYLLWRDRRLALGGFLAPLPLLAMWSPLALIGMMPFAAHAGLETLARRALKPADVLLPALATVLAVPALLYLAAAGDTVGSRPLHIPIAGYLVFELLEVGAFLVAALTIGRRLRFGGVTTSLVAAVLLAAPYVQVGDASDFAMRATIPALAILAVQVADMILAPAATRERQGWRRMLVAVLLVGAVTPLAEIRRALVLPPSPPPRCGYSGLVPGGFPTYVAPLARMPRAIAPARPALVRPADPRRCWDRPWPSA